MTRPNQPTISAALKTIATEIVLPPNQITFQQLDVQLNKPVGYVKRRPGICRHYFARNNASQAELAAEAPHDTLITAILNPTDIDLLIYASAIVIQTSLCSAIHILKAAVMPTGVAGFDIDSNCMSFTSALKVAAGLLDCGAYRRIAIVSVDTASRGIGRNHEESSLIFGDGAACTIAEWGDRRSGIIASLIGIYLEGSKLCEIRAGGTQCNPRSGVSDSSFLFHIQGRPLFRFASSSTENYFSRLLRKNSLQLDDISTVAPHQANHLSLGHMRKRLRMLESVLVDVYYFYDNQVVAFIPTALHEAVINDCSIADKPVMLIGMITGLTLTGVMFLS